MNRLIRAQRVWLVRRLLLLGGSAGAAAAAFAVQLIRLRLDPNGAAVHGVALLVTLIILAILVRLVRLHLEGPGLESPSWERHAHRATVREAPLVGLCGAIVAGLLAAATPRLVAEERRASGAPLEVRVPDPVKDAELAAPIAPAPEPEVAEAPEAPAVEPGPAGPPQPKVESPTAVVRLEPRKSKPLPETPILMLERPVEINYRMQGLFVDAGLGAGSVAPKQDQEDPRPPADPIVHQPAAPLPLPPVHAGFGGFLATPAGRVKLEGGSGRFELNIEDFRGESTFEGAIDFTAELALTPESALKIVYAGMRIFQRGQLESDAAFGSATGLAGDPYEFEMTWSHLYCGLAHRITGYTRGSWFDLSVHAGAMIDHTISRFESDASGVKAEPADGERGWFAPGFGMSMAFRGPGPAGFVFEALQSAPANLGGQTIALTDLRTGVTVDVSSSASLFLGYRYVNATYRTYQETFARVGAGTSAQFEVRGPIIGVDLRF